MTINIQLYQEHVHVIFLITLLRDCRHYHSLSPFARVWFYELNVTSQFSSYACRSPTCNTNARLDYTLTTTGEQSIPAASKFSPVAIVFNHGHASNDLDVAVQIIKLVYGHREHKEAPKCHDSVSPIV